MNDMHTLYRITSAEVLRPYVLRVSFNDGTERDIDLEPILHGELYGPLRDPSLFAQVVVDPQVETVTWPNGADFDPETLRNWPDYEADWVQLAHSWQRAAAP